MYIRIEPKERYKQNSYQKHKNNEKALMSNTKDALPLRHQQQTIAYYRVHESLDTRV